MTPPSGPNRDKETLAEIRRLILENDRALKAVGVIIDTPYYRQIKDVLGLNRRRKPMSAAEFEQAGKDLIKELYG